MKLTSTKDKHLTTISALLHGDSGIGKTTSALTLPEDRTLLAIGDRGALPLRYKDYPVLRFHTWDDIQIIYRMFARPDGIEDAEIKSKVKGTRVLFVDSLSKISDLCVEHIVNVERVSLTRERTGNKRDEPVGIYKKQLTQEDYGLFRSKIAHLLASFTGLNVNIIMTCLSAWSKDKHGGDVYRTPNLPGKIATECPAHFDLVLHMGVNDDNERKWQTFNDGEILAKDSSGALDPYEETDWTKLFSKILKGNANAKP